MGFNRMCLAYQYINNLNVSGHCVLIIVQELAI